MIQELMIKVNPLGFGPDGSLALKIEVHTGIGRVETTKMLDSHRVDSQSLVRILMDEVVCELEDILENG